MGPCTVYEHYGYQGHKWNVRTGNYAMHQLVTARLQDKISSYKVQRGYVLYACEHAGYQGDCKALIGASNVPAHFNDKISSFKCVKGTPPPKITSCSRRAFKLFYTPKVEAGVKLEMKRAANGDKRFLNTVGRDHVPLPREIERWFHSWRLRSFFVRFIRNGIPGPYTLCKYNTPIGLDLDGSGTVERIELQDGLSMDLTGNGVEETIYEWFAPTEGILVDVTTGFENGKVTGQHLFGEMEGQYLHGYDKLASTHDMDQNGIVEGKEELDGLALWKDANSNGLMDEGELSSLAEHGIVSLNVMHHDFVSTAATNNGSSIVMEDLFFSE